MTVFRLHLNGGPRDDTYLDHWTSTFEVAALYGGITTMLAAVDKAEPIPAKRGRYELRIDGNGEPVPHNLEGFVECDWRGWDK